MAKVQDLGEVEGLKELEKALVALGGAFAVKELRKAMMYATKPTLDVMKKLVPVGSGKGTDSQGKTKSSGRLKKSIKRKFKTKNIGRSAAEIDVGAMGKNAYYAKWVEFGTAPHFVNKGANRVNSSGREINKISGKGGSSNAKKMHPGAAPNPFIRPAWSMTNGFLVPRFKAKLIENMNKITSKAA